MNQYDVVQGTFNPKRTDNLKDRVKPYIGVSALWQACWIIESGPYAGQWAMCPYEWAPAGLFNVPECDIDVTSEPIAPEATAEEIARVIEARDAELSKLHH